MMEASKFAYKKKLLPLKDLILIKQHYKNLNLPMNIKKHFRRNEIKKIISFMKKDKKNINEKVNLVLIKKIGKIIKPNRINVNGQEIKNFLMQSF